MFNPSMVGGFLHNAAASSSRLPTASIRYIPLSISSTLRVPRRRVGGTDGRTRTLVHTRIPFRRFSSTAAAALQLDQQRGETYRQEHVQKTGPDHSQSGHDAAATREARARLGPVVDALGGPVDWAVAYGSGVMHQANASGLPPPLTDFILSTPSPLDFHRTNLRLHPSHYPLYARVLGARAVAWIQDQFGAGLWYVTNVRVAGLEVKYGVVSTSTLVRDLEDWDTLYVSGRLHKPVLTLSTTPSIAAAIDSNARSALNLALVAIPPAEPFTELALWEHIAGISYSGDPRMSVPGAENPEKVRNIVRGKGVLDGFRRLYAPHVARTGLRWADANSASDSGSRLGQGFGSAADARSDPNPGAVAPWAWRGNGEALLEQPNSTSHYAALLASLPFTLRRNIARHFRPTRVGALVSPSVRAERADLRAGPLELHDDPQFWYRVVEQDRFREVVQNELRHIVRRPALTQSIKGLATAGLVKSIVYSAAKFRKWLRGRRKA